MKADNKAEDGCVFAGGIMKEHPILFSSEMVNAVLAERKTQTRRVIKPLLRYHPNLGHFWKKDKSLSWMSKTEVAKNLVTRCPYGQPGDRLWVKETWKAEELVLNGLDGIRYRADDCFRPIENNQAAAELWVVAKREGQPWRPSIYMPRWASRITLEIISVRVEKVQEISEKDAEAEGIHLLGLPEIERYNHPRKHIAAFREIWNLINAKRGYGWDVNPWVWVIDFKKEN
jgi:hypothetical protein